MAKTATSIGVNVGNGPALSTYELLSGRQRQTAIIGDCESDADRLVELPSHGETDRGSALKIGGRASPVAGSVGANDRTDAWFSPNGALGVINTIEPATIYDAGRKAISFMQTSLPALTIATTLVTGTVGQRIKVLGLHVTCGSVGAAGTLYLSDSTPADLLAIDRFTTTGARTIGFTGQNIVQTAVSQNLTIRYDAAASAFFITVAYYKAA